MENIVEINVDLLDKYDLVEKYNKSVVSKNLIDYIIEQAMEYKPNSNFKIIVSKKAQIDHDSTKLIRDGLTKEFEKAKTFHRNENYKQILYLVIGILLIFLATRFSNPMIKLQIARITTIKNKEKFMKKRNLCVIVKNLDLNGISSVVMNYLKKINKDIFSITIISGNSISNKYIKECNENNINLIRLPNQKNTKYYISLLKYLKKGRYDIVHINGSSATIGIELLISYICGIKKRVVHSHNSKGNHKLIHIILKPIVKILATDRIACSDIAGKWMFKDKYVVIPNGFEIEKFIYNNNQRSIIRNKLNIEDKIVIGHTGRINAQKNQQFLIKLIKQIKQKSDNYMLLLIGDGPEEEDIKKMIYEYKCEENVILYGSSEDISKLYSSMDIFVFPSKYEGLGISFLEAQINGLFCIGSSNIPIQAKITNNVEFLDLDNEQVWIEELLKNHERNTIDINAEEIQLYNIEKSVSKLEKVYLG